MNHTILIEDRTGQHILAYTTAEMIDLYTAEQLDALSKGETVLRGSGQHVDLVAYYKRTQG
jgi:hypothetical protein